ncbi:MAG: hypothetical protein FWC06_02050 [Treponema sp.]|nr:hypothetical protein [Treponema sp.]
MKRTAFIISFGAVLLLSSCATTVTIGEDMSSAEIIQRAQEALDRNRYNIAIQYYEALNERNRSSVDLVITSEYHIAFINYKQKKYAEAREGLNGVLAYYDSPDQILLPQHFKRLSQIVLQSIDEKEAK